jgi:hypothetical protein
LDISGKSDGSTSYMIHKIKFPHILIIMLGAVWGGGNHGSTNGGNWGDNATDTQTNAQYSGGQQSLSIIPPYCTVAYIMRSV